jgi:transposase
MWIYTDKIANFPFKQWINGKAKTYGSDQNLATQLSGQWLDHTARQLKMSKNTVREYLRRAEAYSADLSVLLELDEEALGRIIYASHGDQADKRLAVFEQQTEYWIEELRRVGVTRELLWQEYRLEHPEGYGYSQFCVHLRRQVAYRDLTLALDHNPGEV